MAIINTFEGIECQHTGPRSRTSCTDINSQVAHVTGIHLLSQA